MVELRLDMDVIVGQHGPTRWTRAATTPLPRWASPPGARGPALPDDVCRRFRPENARAHHNSDVFALC
jgi:hypothetical protein